nr:HNH endonuclease signature motif containing protein [uncultured Flavobacterium sp.]
MSRNRNTDNHGNNWSEETKSRVWEKGKVDPNFDPKEWRRDVCGFAMRYSDFGERDSLYGWEIDHIYPVAMGGNDDFNNLQPLHWKNNLEKADRTDWTCFR